MKQPNSFLTPLITSVILYISACTTSLQTNTNPQYDGMKNRHDLETRVTTRKQRAKPRTEEKWYNDIDISFGRSGVTGTFYRLEPISINTSNRGRTHPEFILKIRHGIEKSPATYELYEIIKNKEYLK
ncbi:MAG: hypothetical protein ACLFO2_00195 [Candidatus Woesearchaeota archaeon]